MGPTDSFILRKVNIPASICKPEPPTSGTVVLYCSLVSCLYLSAHMSCAAAERRLILFVFMSGSFMSTERDRRQPNFSSSYCCTKHVKQALWPVPKSWAFYFASVFHRPNA